MYSAAILRQYTDTITLFVDLKSRSYHLVSLLYCKRCFSAAYSHFQVTAGSQVYTLGSKNVTMVMCFAHMRHMY